MTKARFAGAERLRGGQRFQVCRPLQCRQHGVAGISRVILEAATGKPKTELGY
jgi:hypothetical protein